MIYFFIGVDLIIGAALFVFYRIIKAGKLTARFVRLSLVIFGPILVILPFLPQPRPEVDMKIVLIVSIILFAAGEALMVAAFTAYNKWSFP